LILVLVFTAGMIITDTATHIQAIYMVVAAGAITEHIRAGVLEAVEQV
jgi:hypothetical protein